MMVSLDITGSWRLAWTIAASAVVAAVLGIFGGIEGRKELGERRMEADEEGPRSN